ncbi:NADH-quinone oxidoreductase subunit N [bacterium]|nr:NADH-quinone oxidoreductase subunit N [bacterium]
MQISLDLVDLLVVSPAIALFLGGLFPIMIKAFSRNKEPNSFVPYGIAVVGTLAALALVAGNWGIQREAFSGALVFDSISAIVSILILIVTLAGLSYLKESPSTQRLQFSEIVFLTMNASIGMLIFAWSNDLIVTFIGIELMSLCLYVLIALSEEEKLSKEAAFKYFILGSFASAVLLYGISFIYGGAGTTSLPEIKELGVNLITTNRMFLIGVIMFFSGLLFKFSIFPFHSWTPDVYQGSPTPITSYMATGVKAATVFFTLRWMSLDILTGERAFPFVDVLQWLAVLTILIGNVGALRQKSLKRMLAYSGIGHSGYVLIGLIAAGIGGQNLVGATGVVYYLFAYTFMTLGSFGVLAALERHSDHEIVLDDLKGLAKRKPVLAISFSVLLLSLAGIPPTVGFFGKFLVLAAAIKQDLNWLALWGVIGSVISVYYYLRPIVAMYMEESILKEESWIPRPMTQFAVSLMALMVIGFGITSESFFAQFFQSILEVFS